MIDFRYHLVSIVSIFMALAVGIVLGAGPLKGTIGDTLTEEVTQLREDRTQLRADLDAAQKAGVVRDEFTEDALARLVGGTLTGTKVALVSLPNAEADQVSAVADALGASGATVVSRTSVDDSWVPEGDDASAQQSQLATDLRRSMGLPQATEGQGSPLDDVLASALLAKDAAAPTDAAKAALERLGDAGLVDLETADLVRADAAVVVGAPVSGGVVERRDLVARRFASLAAALDRAGNGAVLASDVGVSGFQGASSVVRAARGDAAIARDLSTVDDLSVPLGRVSVVYALDQQLAGGVGQYGVGDGVSAGYPPVPAS